MDPPVNLEELPFLIQLFFFLRGTATRPGSLMECDASQSKLQVWRWPVNHRKERIAPSDFHEHRSTHHFQFPGCFCPLQDVGLGLNKETAIYTPTGGPYKNQWVAACATQECLYLVPLAIFYRLDGLAVNHYARRISGDHGPLPILHISEMRDPELFSRDMSPVAPTEIDLSDDGSSESKSHESDLDFAMQMRTQDSVPPSPKTRIYIRRQFALRAANIVVWNPPRSEPLSFFAMIRAIDSAIRPGVPVEDFLSLASLCDCGLLTSRRAFSLHKCQTCPRRHGQIMPQLTLAEVLTGIDSILKPGVPVEEFLHVVAQCACGMLVTRRSFFAHACQAS
ncbi:uncharacterized protein LACBIDRAFT_334457 [Laccaria bicolor S238N-H82]|uniref:Predicted protein n=1 Tax=Laccaria bicolor (strain S238N-H82 / ATCC MYA-4686) TaxID=486041 RepID=B0DZ96_LACBS|nr:uncharacterized protein LACBIDRAFT_334457 [Laccaria bicolor S238N-H82]EDR00050.1 predicted protein [Laccaria bicolor S238N-H82]|eukprot:XP_001889256.1 predicted protein [Laccaria bicolor S238N-H82]